MVIRDAASLVCTTFEQCEEKEKVKVLEKMSSHVKDWINNPWIIGDKMFGYDDTTYSCPHFGKGLSEITVGFACPLFGT